MFDFRFMTGLAPGASATARPPHGGAAAAGTSASFIDALAALAAASTEGFDAAGHTSPTTDEAPVSDGELTGGASAIDASMADTTVAPVVRFVAGTPAFALVEDSGAPDATPDDHADHSSDRPEAQVTTPAREPAPPNTAAGHPAVAAAPVPAQSNTQVPVPARSDAQQTQSGRDVAPESDAHRRQPAPRTDRASGSSPAARAPRAGSAPLSSSAPLASPAANSPSAPLASSAANSPSAPLASSTPGTASSPFVAPTTLSSSAAPIAAPTPPLSPAPIAVSGSQVARSSRHDARPASVSDALPRGLATIPQSQPVAPVGVAPTPVTLGVRPGRALAAPIAGRTAGEASGHALQPDTSSLPVAAATRGASPVGMLDAPLASEVSPSPESFRAAAAAADARRAADAMPEGFDQAPVSGSHVLLPAQGRVLAAVGPGEVPPDVAPRPAQPPSHDALRGDAGGQSGADAVAEALSRVADSADPARAADAMDSGRMPIRRLALTDPPPVLSPDSSDPVPAVAPLDVDVPRLAAAHVLERLRAAIGTAERPPVPAATAAAMTVAAALTSALNDGRPSASAVGPSTPPAPAVSIGSPFAETPAPGSGESGASGSPVAIGAQAAARHPPVAVSPTTTAFASLASNVRSSDTLPPETTTQIVQSIRMQLLRDGGEAHIRLDPRQFGDMSVRIRVDQGQVTARVEADAPVVREWLQNNQHLLRQSLAGQQLTLDRLDVREPPATPDTSRRDGSPERERDAPEQRPRRRRPDTGELFEVVA